MSKDYYQILGVSKNASSEEIKAAYRRLAKQYHPDVNKEKGAESKFKEISEAYQILSDPQKKQTFDQYGSAAFEQGAGGFTGGAGNIRWEDFGFGSQTSGGFRDPFEIFEEFFGSSSPFGGFGREGREEGGRDLLLDLEIDFMTAVHGGEREISYKRKVSCPHCHGLGAEPGSRSTLCDICKGSGQVRQVQRTIFGQFATTTVCPKCQGEGRILDKKCVQCKGKAVIEAYERITVKIPAGVDNGTRLKLAERGEAGKRGETGDLFIRFHVKPHSLFKREDLNIYLDKSISFTQAALGAQIKVETIDGEVELKIPPGTQTHTVFRLKGKGVQKPYSGVKGDEFVRVIVKTPERLSQRQKEVLLEFDKVN